MNDPTTPRAEESTRPRNLAGLPGLILILSLFAVASTVLTWRLPAAGDISTTLKASVYGAVFAFEWILAGYVVWQLRRLSLRVGNVINMPSTPKRWLVDILIACGFWVLLIALEGVFVWLLRPGQERYLILVPGNRIETGLWIVLSMAAGFCEELVFRGYLQRILESSWNAGLAIALQAVIFGLVHWYQGFKNVALIVVLGLMLGLLARWRGSLWPGMLAHMWVDIAGVLLR